MCRVVHDVDNSLVVQASGRVLNLEYRFLTFVFGLLCPPVWLVPRNGIKAHCERWNRHAFGDNTYPVIVAAPHSLSMADYSQNARPNGALDIYPSHCRTSSISLVSKAIVPPQYDCYFHPRYTIVRVESVGRKRTRRSAAYLGCRSVLLHAYHACKISVMAAFTRWQPAK